MARNLTMFMLILTVYVIEQGVGVGEIFDFWATEGLESTPDIEHS
jgi:hypothetical protein